MAETTVQTNNEWLKYRLQIIEAMFRRNQFSPYMGEGVNAVIQRLIETRDGGDQINVPIVNQLSGEGRGTGTLVNNEESIEDYGCRVWIDTKRNATTARQRELQKQSAKVFERSSGLLSNWGVNNQRDSLIQAMMALPSESPPVGLESDIGEPVNGIKYEDASAAQLNAWRAANVDRILYGNSLANSATDHATSLGNIAATDTFKGASVLKMKDLARKGNQSRHRITPTRTDTANNREFYIMFVGTRCFNDLSVDLETANADARPRDVGKNPLFQDGDLIWRGVIVRDIPEIDYFTDNSWTGLASAGSGGIQVNPAFLCGQGAVGMPWGVMPTPTVLKEDDYQEKVGLGITMTYGAAKLFRRLPKTSANLIQTGIVTGFFAQSTQ